MIKEPCLLDGTLMIKEPCLFPGTLMIKETQFIAWNPDDNRNPVNYLEPV